MSKSINVMQDDGKVVTMSGKRVPKQPCVCGCGTMYYSMLFDAFYCCECGEWACSVCGDPDCDFCADRPERMPVEEYRRRLV